MKLGMDKLKQLAQRLHPRRTDRGRPPTLAARKDRPLRPTLTRTPSILLCAVLSLVTTACAPKASHEVAGIEGTGDTATSYGTVTGFGSIYVNGQRFRTDNAAFVIDGEPGAESDLRTGRVVMITGDIDSDTGELLALEVSADRILSGQIDSVDVVDWSRKTLEVAGQTVYLGQDVIFENTRFQELAPGMSVSIDGFISEEGLVNATYLRRESSELALIEIEARIAELNAEAQTFKLNEMLVEFAAAALPSGQTLADLRDDLHVEVQGEVQNGVFIAQKLRTKEALRLASGSRVNLEGIVQLELSDYQFLLNDQLVEVPAEQAPLHERGIAEGVRVVVAGTVVDTTLRAESLSTKPQNNLRFAGQISDIDPDAQTLVVSGSEFKTHTLTIFSDTRMNPIRDFGFADLRIGERVEIFAHKAGEQWRIARITREDDPGPWFNELNGRLDAMAGPSSFIVQGIMVDGSQLPLDDLRKLRVGMFVTVKGFPNGMFSFSAESIILYPEIKCDDSVFFNCMPDNHFHGTKKHFR